jgi:hypothetical protein
MSTVFHACAKYNAEKIFCNGNDLAGLPAPDVLQTIPPVLSSIAATGANASTALADSADNVAKKYTGLRGQLLEMGLTGTNVAGIFDSHSPRPLFISGAGFKTTALDFVLSFTQALNEMFIKALAAKLTEKIFGAAGGGEDGGGNIGHLAVGGFVNGPGTSTSDSVPIMASNGEFMMNAQAVSRYGPRFMDSLNRGEYNPQTATHMPTARPSTLATSPSICRTCAMRQR